MNETRELNFPKPGESYRSNPNVVIFWGLDGNNEVLCKISGEAIEDHFDCSKVNGPLVAFQLNRLVIQDKARRKYLAGKVEEDDSILIRTEDF